MNWLHPHIYSITPHTVSLSLTHTHTEREKRDGGMGDIGDKKQRGGVML